MARLYRAISLTYLIKYFYTEILFQLYKLTVSYDHPQKSPT